MRESTVTVPLSAVLRRIAVATALVASLAAGCGSSAAVTPSPTPGDGTEPGQPPTQALESSQPVTLTPDGGGGGAGSNFDIEGTAKALVPPNSTEVTKTTAADTWFTMYETTDSLDTLKAFYEDAIPKAGLQVITTSTAGGALSWAIASDVEGTYGGAVSIFPSSDGKNAVQVTIGKS